MRIFLPSIAMGVSCLDVEVLSFLLSGGKWKQISFHEPANRHGLCVLVKLQNA